MVQKLGLFTLVKDVARGPTTPNELNQKTDPPSRCTQDQKKREGEKERIHEGESKRGRGTPEETSIIGTRLSDGPGRSQKSTLKPTAMPLVGSERLGVFGPSIAIAMTGPEARRAAIGTTSSGGLLSLCAQHAHDVVEGLLDIDAVLGGGLDEVAAELLGQRLAFLRGDGALDGLVALVADEHDGDGHGGVGGAHGGVQVAGPGGGAGAGGFLDHLDLVVEFGDAGEGGAGGDAVDQDEALAVPDPLVAQCGVFFLTRCVQHLEHTGLLIDHDLFAI